MFIAPILLVACNGGTQEEKPLAAQSAAVDVRASWDKSMKPIAIEIENPPSGLSTLGVYADIKDATEDELRAFQGVEFFRSGIRFLSRDKRAVACDSTASVNCSWPLRRNVVPDASVRVEAPFGENLYGIETGRHNDTTFLFVSQMELKSSMAVLQLVFESDRLADILQEVKVQGEKIAISGDYNPYKGEWSNLSFTSSVNDTDADCLMANGRDHDIHLVPTNDGAPVKIMCRINGKEMYVKTTLHPMAAGSLTRLNIRKESDALRINGSWVATKRPLRIKTISNPDTIKIGMFLRKDGYIVAKHDSLCVAMVIKTDGKHGKAVALKDSDDEFTFCDKPLSSGHIFPTIDGERKEGVINPRKAEEADDSSTIVLTGNLEYPDDCAIGFMDGSALTDALLKRYESGIERSKGKENPMLPEVSSNIGTYVPSLGELAYFYTLCNPLKGEADFPDFFIPLDGDYLTSSESGIKTFYSIGFPGGIINGSPSKLYAKSKLRLFYLF